MNPSPPAIALIKTFVTGLSGGWAGNTDAQIVAAANDPTIANAPGVPGYQPQGMIQTPYTFVSLLGGLSQPSAANVESFPGISNLFDDILAQSTSRVLAAVQLMAASGRMTSGEAAALGAILTATEPDPGWPSLVGWAQANLGRPLDLDDSAIARALQ